MQENQEKQNSGKQKSLSCIYVGFAKRYALVALLLGVVFAVLLVIDRQVTQYYTAVLFVFAILFGVLTAIVICFTIFLFYRSTSYFKTEQVAKNGRAVMAKVNTLTPSMLGLADLKLSMDDVLDEDGTETLFECFTSIRNADVNIVKMLGRIPVFHSGDLVLVRQLELLQMIRQVRAESRGRKLDNLPKKELISNRCKNCTGSVMFDKNGKGKCNHCGMTFEREINGG